MKKYVLAMAALLIAVGHSTISAKRTFSGFWGFYCYGHNEKDAYVSAMCCVPGSKQDTVSANRCCEKTETFNDGTKFVRNCIQGAVTSAPRDPNKKIDKIGVTFGGKLVIHYTDGTTSRDALGEGLLIAPFQKVIDSYKASLDQETNPEQKAMLQHLIDGQNSSIEKLKTEVK